jgi:putative Mn2+ efflux pump MntP
MRFFNTFRGRLLLILALLLFATLGVQYYLNLLTQQENDDLREAQEQAIVAGIAVGISSLTSTERVQDLIVQPGQSFVDEQAKKGHNCY